jgi:hypothetical protein
MNIWVIPSKKVTQSAKPSTNKVAASLKPAKDNTGSPSK